MGTFGLAQAKVEGEVIDLDSKHQGSDEVSTTTWVEMCYDPKEELSDTAESMLLTMTGMIKSNNLTEDDTYRLIKKLAYVHIDDLDYL